MGEKINTYRLSVQKPGGNKRLGRPKHGWKDSIKIDLK
jgi:hypothetical protein